MNTDPNCIFCKIIAGQIPSYKVYEDEVVLAFLSIGPVNEGHTLVIPKNHCETFLDLTESENSHIFKISQLIGKKINSELKPKKVGMLVAGWDVPHTHIHIVPMNEYHDLTSEKMLKNSMPKFSSEKMQQTLSKIKL